MLLSNLRNKKMVKKIFIILFVALIAGQSFGQKDAGMAIDVKPVNGSMLIDGHQLFYSLPLNKIVVGISVTKTIMAKGPYAEFAAKHLNITSGIIEADGTEFRIDSISVQRISQADSSKQYSVHYNGIENLPKLQLSSDGCLLAYNCPVVVSGSSSAASIISYKEQPNEVTPFYDLGTKSFFEEEKENNHSAPDDTIKIKQPYEDGKLTPKTPDENAADAAAFIRKIRKRRLKLLVSMYQESNAVDGSAMKVMVDELEKLEKSYLELFVGRMESVSYTLSYIYTPQENSETDLHTLCWFSKTLGIVNQKSDIRRNDFKPVTIRVQQAGNNPKINLQTIDPASKNATSVRYGLFYRVSATTDVTVECSEHIIVKQQMQIAQKGFIIPLPGEYFTNQKYSIEFDGATGSLKRISVNP
jgi:hypothetical protein